MIFIALPAFPASAQTVIQRVQSQQVGFQGQWEEIQTIYTFGLDGGLVVEESKGSEFFFPAPKFQPAFKPIVKLSENETHVIQHFWVNGSIINAVGKEQTKTLDLWVYFDFTVYPLGAKIRLIGSTNDVDSEIEYQFENPKSLNYANNLTSYTVGMITFNWGDLQSATRFEALSNRLKVKFASKFDLDPSIVTTVSVSSPNYAFQRKIIYDAGHWWYFYAYGGNLVYRTSSDGGSWSSETQTGAQASDGWHFSVWHNSPNISLVTVLTSTQYLYYRKGTLNSAGTITWSADLQTIASGSEISTTTNYPTIAEDSGGYPYVTYGTQTTNLSMTKSDLKNGTWSTTSGYPIQLNDNSISNVYGVVLPLTSQKMVALYRGLGTVFKSRIYNGTSWLTEEQASTSSVQSAFFSAVTIGDNVYLAFEKEAVAYTAFLTRTYGSGWSSEHTFEYLRKGPALSKVGTAKLYLFLIQYSDPIWTDSITFREYDIATDTWGEEGSLSYKPNIGSLSSLYQSTSNDELGLGWRMSAANVLFFAKITTQPPTIPETEIPSGYDEPKPEEEEKPPSTEEEKPSILPKLGVWGLLGAIGLISLGGVMAYVDQPRKRNPQKSSYQASSSSKSYYHKPPPQPEQRRHH